MDSHVLKTEIEVEVDKKDKEVSVNADIYFTCCVRCLDHIGRVSIYKVFCKNPDVVQMMDDVSFEFPADMFIYYRYKYKRRLGRLFNEFLGFMQRCWLAIKLIFRGKIYFGSQIAITTETLKKIIDTTVQLEQDVIKRAEEEFAKL